MPYTTKPCDCCGNLTKNPRFCSRSCSTKVTNKESQKRFMTKQCQLCFKNIPSSKKFCAEHTPKIFHLDKTLNDFKIKAKYQLFAHIRNLARKIYRTSQKPRECFVCKYNKHIEICHIKPISSYDPNTKLSIVNDINNLIALCPNHHWELDNGIISIR